MSEENKESYLKQKEENHYLKYWIIVPLILAILYLLFLGISSSREGTSKTTLVPKSSATVSSGRDIEQVKQEVLKQIETVQNLGLNNARQTTKEVYAYEGCRTVGQYCYGEDFQGNEVGFYVYSLNGGYGYGEDDSGKEVEFYYDSSFNDVYIYDYCETYDYCYGEDTYGNEIEFYVYDLYDGYGYGEDDYGNEVEFYYDY